MPCRQGSMSSTFNSKCALGMTDASLDTSWTQKDPNSSSMDSSSAMVLGGPSGLEERWAPRGSRIHPTAQRPLDQVVSQKHLSPEIWASQVPRYSLVAISR